MKVRLQIWRQPEAKATGELRTYELSDVSADMSFLEMLDVLNEELIGRGDDPVAFDHDCREGICGACGVMIDGVAHGPMPATTTCQLHMRSFQSAELRESDAFIEIVVEPWRARAFPVIKDLVVDRSAFDRIIQAGGYVSVRTGSAPDANEVPIPKPKADRAFDAAACIGCGACVAACPNASAALFTAAKVAHLALLPQGQPERTRRARLMVAQHDREGFGGCTSHRECEAACPKEIGVHHIATMNRELLRAALLDDED